jgi:tRNA(Met) C34 N-acetyltransferase TmcA
MPMQGQQHVRFAGGDQATAWLLPLLYSCARSRIQSLPGQRRPAAVACKNANWAGDIIATQVSGKHAIEPFCLQRKLTITMIAVDADSADGGSAGRLLHAAVCMRGN